MPNLLYLKIYICINNIKSIKLLFFRQLSGIEQGSKMTKMSHSTFNVKHMQNCGGLNFSPSHPPTISLVTISLNRK